ncbi:cupin domain-containing protein [Aeromonas hydrophila]|uniref:cupin domain-containing protein n=1 Tax=Aeromonas hydrophila TaxID=644 RepID=UPI0028080B7C|nr:cupin domain-containing protein [Aeromonas hydrophila]ELA9381897.1 cupin domain-containing protein [Aeromonas hydrophila]
MNRHPSIKHWRELQEPEPGRYSGSEEPLSLGSALGRHYSFARLGIHHELLPPGRRTSWPHAEETEDEFVHVLEGTPDVWLDGVLHRLQPGDSVGFKAGDGLAHTFINNTNQPVRLLCVGDTDRADNHIHYAVHPERNRFIGARHWDAVPERELGEHDGLPDQLRERNGPF